ncbi:chaperonin GroEL [Arboricoccus pini]|uniref:60 kDa chaperonin n=1 Tax=Arboricoccus pini TaxID=1963835 RepID=A0A212RG80_9PROT|nr:molecular chaperone GroEL [Arboricoccus pini]SNB71365.1 chaperonin GroEL [Arboricoccus pini]
MAKIMLHDAEARQALARGVAKLALAVGGTLGPKGMNVIIDRPVGTPIVSRDGVSIADEIELPCRFENLGVRVAREVAKQTNDLVGDGTTTATVLADALVREGLGTLERGVAAVDLVDGIELAAGRLIATLEAMARPIGGRGQLDAVATISAGDAELGGLVAEALERVGPEGIVRVDFGNKLKTELEVVEGMSFDRGYHSHHMVTDMERMVAVLERPLILLTDRKLEHPEEIEPLLAKVVEAKRPLLIIAEDISPEVMVSLLAKARFGDRPVVAVHPPEFGHWRQATMEDLAILTGGRVLARDLGARLETLALNDLGEAMRVIVSQNETAIINGGGTSSAMVARRKQVQRQIELAPPNIERDKLEERLARLTGGTATLKVGGATPAEQKRRVQLLDDAHAAARAAMAGGILPGGGTAYVQAARTLDDVGEGSLAIGVLTLQRALSAPLHRIATNAGFEGDVIVERVSGAAPGTGFDARTGRLVDMVESGILDPAPVATTALRNAASIAALILNTHTLVVDLPEDVDTTVGAALGGGAEKLGRQ